MIPLAVPNLSGNESKYLQECISSNFVSSVGPFVSRFEQQLSEASGARHSVCTSSGTTALHLALLASGVKPGDLVIAPSFTFIASANAISHCGATPWLFDVEPYSWTLDPEQLREELKIHVTLKDGAPYHKKLDKKIAALMPVHVLGNPADMDSMIDIAMEYSIPIVADGAASLGATYKSGPISRPGVLTTFSFNGNKTITTGGGGAVCGDDVNKINLIRHISSTARVGSDYHHDQVGFNYRMTNVQAALGCAQMERLASFVQRKREVDLSYRQAFDGLKGFKHFPRPTWGESACWFAGVVLENQGAVQALRTKLAQDGIDSKPFWKPVHLQPPYAKSPQADFALTNEIWSRILTLPCSTNITETELNSVINSVLGYASVKSA